MIYMPPPHDKIGFLKYLIVAINPTLPFFPHKTRFPAYRTHLLSSDFLSLMCVCFVVFPKSFSEAVSRDFVFFHFILSYDYLFWRVYFD